MRFTEFLVLILMVLVIGLLAFPKIQAAINDRFNRNAEQIRSIR